MRFLLVGPIYGNAGHGAEQGVYDALKHLGHNVAAWDYRVNAFLKDGVRINYGNNEDILKELLKTSSSDIILCLGAGLPEAVLESSPWKMLSKSLKVLWTSEPIRLESYKNKTLAQKHQYNIIFTFDESEIPIFKNNGVSAVWLPQAYNDAWYHPVPVATGQRFSKHLVFIGSIGGKWLHRENLIKRIKDLGYKINVATIFDAERVNRAYNMHDGVLNLGLYVPDECGDPNHFKAFGLQQRIFEAYGSGKVCLTNEIPTGTNKLFTHGEDILFYNSDNLPDMIDICFNKKERERMETNIIKNRQKHSYVDRMKKMINVLEW